MHGQPHIRSGYPLVNCVLKYIGNCLLLTEFQKLFKMRSSMFIAQPPILSQSILQTHRHNSGRYQNSIWNMFSVNWTLSHSHVCVYMCMYVYFQLRLRTVFSILSWHREGKELRRYFCEECFKYQPPLPSTFTPVYSNLPFIAVSDVVVTITYWIISGSIAVPLNRWYASHWYYAKAHLVVREDI